MSNKPIQAKVSVTTEDGQLELFTLNKSEGLESNIKMLCQRFGQVSVFYFTKKNLQPILC